MASEGDGAITMPRAELNLKDELIAANLTRYEYFIVNGVRGTELLSAMPIIDARTKNHIREMEDSHGKERATHALLEWLRKSTEVEHRYTAFLDALQQAKYEIQSDLLLGQDIADTTNEEKLINLMAKEFENVDPLEILPSLRRENVINQLDMDEIETAYTNKSRIEACTKMMYCVPRRKRAWFEAFLGVLASNRYGHIVEKVDDIFYAKWKQRSQHTGREEEMDVAGMSDDGRYTKNNVQYKWKQRSQHTGREEEMDVAGMSDDGRYTMENVQYSSGDPEDAGNLCAQLLRRTPLSGSGGPEDAENLCAKQLNIPVSDVLQPPGRDSDDATHTNEIIYLQTPSDGNSQTESPLNSLETSPQNNISGEQLAKNHAGSKKYMEELLDLDSTTDSVNVDPTDGAESITDNRYHPDGVESDSDDDSIQFPRKPIHLRSYQTELAEPALHGNNTVIVAPTSSGKTHVALKIMEVHMLNISQQRIPKIIFLTEQSSLAVQQGKLCKEHLNSKVKIITGEIQRNGKLRKISFWLEKYNVMVVTAQLLVNALVQQDVNISQFTLIVFDECHHTNISHPFNRIMNFYLDIKLSQTDDTRRSLPQIVGLTASVGVGKARQEEEAVGWIQKIMAHLDASHLSTVRKCKRELAEFVSVTQQTTVQVARRKNNMFGEALTNLMSTVVKYMNRSKYIKSSPWLVKSLTPPSVVGSDQYTQWISVLRQETPKVFDSYARRFFSSCRAYLDIYNRTMIIYSDARVQDALNFLEEKVTEINENAKKDDTDTKLEEIYNESRRLVLQHCPTAENQENPKLEGLQKILIDAYEDNPESRVILFVKTRDLAKAIRTWMKEATDLKLLDLKPEVFVGTQAAPGQGGMTRHGQDEVLEKFRSGEHKIIIATSVAEEGLDIPKCNLIIRYNHSTNEIAMVQSRGRGRADGSKCILLTDVDAPAAAKEELNIIRERMMDKAITDVQDLIEKDREGFRKRKRSQQHQEMTKREERKKFKHATEEGEFEIRCGKCDQFICMASDIRKIMNAHHAVLTPEVLERVSAKKSVMPHYTDSEIQSAVGKLSCFQCGYELGNVSIHQATEFAILKASQILIVDSHDNKNIIKKWKKAPFSPRNMSEGDKQRWMQSNCTFLEASI